LQLALNYTTSTVTMTSNSSTEYNTTNSTDAVFEQQQLSRVIDKHCFQALGCSAQDGTHYVMRHPSWSM